MGSELGLHCRLRCASQWPSNQQEHDAVFFHGPTEIDDQCIIQPSVNRKTQAPASLPASSVFLSTVGGQWDWVWTTSRGLTVSLAFLTLIAGVLPAVIAYIGQLIVDSVVTAMAAAEPDTNHVLWLIVLEAIVVIAVAASQRGISVSQSLAASIARPTRQCDDPGKSIDLAACPF